MKRSTHVIMFFCLMILIQGCEKLGASSTTSPSNSNRVVNQNHSASMLDFALTALNSAIRGLFVHSGSQWVSINGDVANVKMYDAVGDGVTDDTLAIQNAIDAAAEIHGVVYFPAGNFIHTGLYLRTGVRLQGLNRDASSLSFISGSGDGIIVAPNSSGSSIKDLTILGAGDSTGWAIRTAGDSMDHTTRDFLVERVLIRGAANGIFIWNSENSTLNNIKMVGRYPRAGGTAIQLGTNGIGGNQITVQDVYLNSFRIGIDNYSPGALITRPTFEGNGSGLVSRARATLINPWTTPNAGAQVDWDVEVLTDAGLIIIGYSDHKINFASAAARDHTVLY